MLGRLALSVVALGAMALGALGQEAAGWDARAHAAHTTRALLELPSRQLQSCVPDTVLTPERALAFSEALQAYATQMNAQAQQACSSCGIGCVREDDATG